MRFGVFYFTIIILSRIVFGGENVVSLTTCGSDFMSSNGQFESDDFPGYPADHNCSWTIWNTQGGIVVLQFTSFEVQGPLGCPYDRVTIYDGVPGENGQTDIIGVYCHTDDEGGTTIPEFIRSSGDVMTVTLETDSSQQYAGFQAIFWNSYDCADASFDIAFILDVSGSVGRANFRKSLNLIRYTLFGLDVDSGRIRVGLVTFSDSAFPQFSLNTHTTKSQLFAALNNVPYSTGSTNTASGLRYAREQIFQQLNGDRPNVPNLAILIVDGESNSDQSQTIPQANLLKNAGVTIRVIAINFVSFTEGLQISSSPKELYNFNSDSFDEIFATRDVSYFPLCMPPRLNVSLVTLSTQFEVATFHNFECHSGLAVEDVEEYVWKANSVEFNRTQGSTIQNLMVITSFYFECTVSFYYDYFNSSFNDHIEGIDIQVPPIPAPILTSASHGPFYFYGNTYRFTCDSSAMGPAQAFITSYLWKFGDNVERSDFSFYDFFADGSNDVSISCAIEIVDFLTASSPFSNVINMITRVIPPPRVEIANRPSRFLVGTEYTFTCHTIQPYTQYISHFTFSINGDTLGEDSAPSVLPVVLQEDDYLVIEATEEIQEITCAPSVDSFTFESSEPFACFGTGIINIQVSVSNARPYPGTNITLNSFVDLVLGYTVDDVLFNWKDDEQSLFIGQNRMVYVPTGMDISPRCIASTGILEIDSNTLTVTARELPPPTLIVEHEPSDGLYEPSAQHTLICISDSRITDIITSITWRRDGAIIDGVTTDRLDITALSTTHNYTCAVRVNAEESPISNQKQIRCKSIISVDIENNGVRRSFWNPLIGSFLNLTCAATFKPGITETPTYEWIYNSLTLQTGRQFFLTTFAGLQGAVTVRATCGDDVMESEPVDFMAQETLIVPSVVLLTITGSSVSGRPQSGDSYIVQCLTSARSLNITINWIKDGSDILCTSDERLYIQRYFPNLHDGAFQCGTQCLGETSESSITFFSGSDG